GSNPVGVTTSARLGETAGPLLSRTTMRNDRALALLRIAVGALFLVFGEYKVADSRFVDSGFRYWIDRFLQGGAYPFMTPILRGPRPPRAGALLRGLRHRPRRCRVRDQAALARSVRVQVWPCCPRLKRQKPTSSAAFISTKWAAASGSLPSLRGLNPSRPSAA